MLIERVDTTRPNQAHHVQRAVVPTCVLDQLHESRNAKELASINRLRDADEILRHDAAGAEIQMSDFAVTDLSLGKTDGETGCLEQRARRAIPQLVPHRRPTELDGIALAARPEAPPVEHDEDHRRGGAHAAGRCHIEGDAS